MAKALKRRDFLKMAGVTALAVSVAGTLGGCGGEPDYPSSSSSRPSSSGSSSSGSSSSSSSSSEAQPAKIIWKISANSDGTARITGYDSAGDAPAGTVTLPTKISGHTITSVDCDLGNRVTKIIIPGCIKLVLNIARDNLSLREVILQEGVEQLGSNNFAYTYRSFAGCKNLSSVQLPKSLKVIEQYSFADCTSLKSISLPESLTTLGENAFYRSGLRNVVIPSTVTNLGKRAFSESNLEEVNIKCGEKGWGTLCGYQTFYSCTKLKKVTFNDKTANISTNMFRKCTALEAITLPKKLTAIEGGAFTDCTSLTTLSIPASVTSIGNEAFSGCSSLQKANILGSIKKISWKCFENCKKLSTVFVPMTVTEIERYAFNGCMNLRDVYYPLNESAWAGISIGDDNSFLTAAELHTNASPLMI